VRQRGWQIKMEFNVYSEAPSSCWHEEMSVGTNVFRNLKHDIIITDCRLKGSYLRRDTVGHVAVVCITSKLTVSFHDGNIIKLVRINTHIGKCILYLHYFSYIKPEGSWSFYYLRIALDMFFVCLLLERVIKVHFYLE